MLHSISLNFSLPHFTLTVFRDSGVMNFNSGAIFVSPHIVIALLIIF